MLKVKGPKVVVGGVSEKLHMLAESMGREVEMWRAELTSYAHSGRIKDLEMPFNAHSHRMPIIVS